MKCHRLQGHAEAAGSLSSWRAWIEMPGTTRNAEPSHGRSPHGERGLKCFVGLSAGGKSLVALLMESVD